MQLQNFYAQDVNGNIVPGAICSLFLPGTTTLATGLEDASGSPLANPFTATSNGLVQLAAPNGAYDLKIEAGLIVSTLPVVFADTLQALIQLGGFLPPSATPPTTRADGTPLQLGDRYMGTPEDIEYIYKGSGWEPNNLDGQIIADSTDPAKGSAAVGRSWQAADSIAQLKTLSTSGPSRYASLSGRYAKGDGGDALWYVPNSFVGLADGLLVVQANDGGFWVMNHNGIIPARAGGLRCDGVTDDGPTWAALTVELSLIGADLGNAIVLTPRDRMRVKTNTTLEGDSWIKGSSGAGSNLNNLTAAQIVLGGSSILIDAAVTVTPKGACRFSGVTFTNPLITGNLPDSSSFAGTAITAGGDDIRFDYCAFMGFNKAFYSDSYARASFDHCNFDVQSGIDIRNSFDVPRITQCQFWPWLTVATGNVGVGTANSFYRSGTAISMDNVSWPELDGIFTFGYAVGLNMNDVVNPRVRADLEGTRDSAGNIIPTTGCRITGSTSKGSFSLNTAHHLYGVRQAVNLGLHNKIHSGMYRDSSGAGILIETGDATISNNSTTGLQTGVGGIGISVLNTAGVVLIDHRTEAEAEGARIANTLTSVIRMFHSGTIIPVNTLAQQFQIVAAATLPVRAYNDNWYVTGTTGISNFSETFSGHRITVIFTQALTLTDGAGAGALRVGGSLAVSAGQTLQFVCNGITGAMTWRRIS